MSEALLIFGKHPAWADFMEDGLAQAHAFRPWAHALLDAIERAIVAGKWGAPGQPAPDSLINFGHELAWSHKGQLAVARINPSVDARGRRLYPLIAAEEINHQRALDASRAAMQRIDTLITNIEQLREPDQVQRALADARERTTISFREALQTNGNSTVDHDQAAPTAQPDHWAQLMARIFQDPTDNPYAPAIHAALAELDDADALAHTTDTHNAASASEAATLTFAFRLPIPADTPDRAATTLLPLADAIRDDIHLACIAPDHHDWIDLIVGLPTAETIAPIRLSNAEQISPTPLNESAPARPLHCINQWRLGKKLTTSTAPAQPHTDHNTPATRPAGNASHPEAKRRWRWLGLLA